MRLLLLLLLLLLLNLVLLVEDVGIRRLIVNVIFLVEIRRQSRDADVSSVKSGESRKLVVKSLCVAAQIWDAARRHHPGTAGCRHPGTAGGRHPGFAGRHHPVFDDIGRTNDAHGIWVIVVEDGQTRVWMGVILDQVVWVSEIQPIRRTQLIR